MIPGARKTQEQRSDTRTMTAKSVYHFVSRSVPEDAQFADTHGTCCLKRVHVSLKLIGLQRTWCGVFIFELPAISRMWKLSSLSALR